MEGQKRQLDELGRIVIPIDVRDPLGWGPGTKLEVSSDIAARSITVREVTPRCSLCRVEFDDLVKVEKGYVCPSCAMKLK